MYLLNISERHLRKMRIYISRSVLPLFFQTFFRCMLSNATLSPATLLRRRILRRRIFTKAINYEEGRVSNTHQSADSGNNRRTRTGRARCGRESSLEIQNQMRTWDIFRWPHAIGNITHLVLDVRPRLISEAYLAISEWIRGFIYLTRHLPAPKERTSWNYFI